MIDVLGEPLTVLAVLIGAISAGVLAGLLVAWWADRRLRQVRRELDAHERQHGPR